MKLMDWLKKALPAPRIPQKRYIVVLGVVAYILAKVYVAHTPSPDDDHYPDQVRDVVVEYFASAEDKPDPSSDYDKDGLRFGEGYS